MGQAMPKRAKSKKQKTRFKDDDSKPNSNMSQWTEVPRQDPWGPSHDKSGWQPTGNAEWSATPTQEPAWMTWGHSERDAGGGACGNDTHRKERGPGDGHQDWNEGEEEEEEEEEGDGDSGWGGDAPHWTTTVKDGGGFRSHWTKWGREEGGSLPPIPPSAIKQSHSTLQPSTGHQRAPSHKSRPASTRSQPKPHARTSPRTHRPSTWRSSSSSDGLSYADDEPPLQLQRIPPQEDYFTPKSPYTPVSPSRTLAAAMGLPSSATHFISPYGKDPQGHRFISSDGAALSLAYQALYSTTRRAQDRLLWAYNPDNDERVKSVLWWIHMMSEGIGGHGLHRFLETRKRGALFVNAGYAPPESPNEPAFDWVTVDRLKDTLDKILQESVALYDPGKQVIVFIFLLSKSGNSMAIWRRKIPVPEILQKGYESEIVATKAGLGQNCPVYVEELPQKAPPEEQLGNKGPPPRRVLSKRNKSAGTVAATTSITPTTEVALPVVRKKKWWKPWSSKSRSKAPTKKK